MIKLSAFVVILISCGTAGLHDNPKVVHHVENCTVTELPEGAEISCPDGTSVVVEDGKAGADGANGTDGADGEAGMDGEDGEDGLDGIDGVDGVDGKVKQVGAPLYLGYYCGRTVIKIGGKAYVIHGGLVQLSKAWFRVSTACELRFKNGEVLQR